jgi:hypothetical protein
MIAGAIFMAISLPFDRAVGAQVVLGFGGRDIIEVHHPLVQLPAYHKAIGLLPAYQRSQHLNPNQSRRGLPDAANVNCEWCEPISRQQFVIRQFDRDRAI